MKHWCKWMGGLLLLVNLMAALWVIRGLPDQVATHYNYQFVVDGLSSKWILAIFPAICALFYIAIGVEIKLRGREYANRKVLVRFAWVFELFFIVLGWAMIAIGSEGAQLGETVDFPLDLLMGLGFAALFVVLGNYLPTVKPNRTLGIRTKALLENPQLWRKVHRFAGPIYVLGGLILAVMSLVGFLIDQKWLVMLGMMIAAFGTNAVIYVYYRCSKC